MANLLLTTACNLRCRFCFAGSLTGSSPATTMSLAQYHELLTLVRAAGGTEVRFAGGEPTLHPDLPAMVAAALDQGLRLTVLSNGVMPEAAIRCLEDLDEGRCSVLLNYRGHQLPTRQQDRVNEVIDRLGPKVVLGVTIDQLPFDAEPVLAVLADQRRQTGRFLRIGMAHPVLPSRSNRHLHPKGYPAVGRLLGQLAQTATALAVRLVLDCGFVRCQVDDETAAALRENRAETRFECRPIVDLGPTDQAIHCLATAAWAATGTTGSLQTVRQELARRRRAYERIGIYRECSGCTWRDQGQCDGGCLVHRMARLQPVAPRPMPRQPFWENTFGREDGAREGERSK